MPVPTKADLYRRGSETLVASWQAYASGAPRAAVRRLPGVAAAVFPSEPERSIYNNALLERDLAAGARADAVDAMEAAYATAGIARFAAGRCPFGKSRSASDGTQASEQKDRGVATVRTGVRRPDYRQDTNSPAA